MTASVPQFLGMLIACGAAAGALLARDARLRWGGEGTPRGTRGESDARSPSTATHDKPGRGCNRRREDLFHLVDEAERTAARDRLICMLTSGPVSEQIEAVCQSVG